MNNPLLYFKQKIEISLNRALKNELGHSLFFDFDYNFSRNCFSSTILFNQSEKKKEQVIKLIDSLSLENFSIEINDLYINVFLASSIQKELCSKIIDYLNHKNPSFKKCIINIYYLSSSSLEKIYVIKIFEIIRNLLSFYGYEAETNLINDINIRDDVKFEIKADDFAFSSSIADINIDDSLMDLYSIDFLNLALLSRNYSKKLILNENDLALNVKNKYYLTAYTIARVNKSKKKTALRSNCLDESLLFPYLIQLSEVLEKEDTSLTISPIINLLVQLSNDVFNNNKFFSLKETYAFNEFLKFITNICAFTFLNY
jgi:hypothetical protein